MLSYGALEEPCDRGTLCFWESQTDPCYVEFDCEENTDKGLRQWQKISMSWKQNLCICVCGREKRINSFEMIVIIFKPYKNLNLQFKIDFKSANF